MSRRLGTALAGLSLALGLIAIFSYSRPVSGHEPWLSYAMALAAMLCLVLSGILDDVRPRIVAGWIGLACVIAAITWSVTGSLLQRAVFLSIAGGITVVLAYLLARLRLARQP
jgi:Flp pilus assembly protein protease CpaA